MKKVIIAYVPVLHQGYRKFFERHTDVDTLYIFGDSLIKKYDYLAKEIRQLSPNLVKRAIESWKMFKKIEILEEKGLKSLETIEIIMPDEDVCIDLATEFFGEKIARIIVIISFILLFFFLLITFLWGELNMT